MPPYEIASHPQESHVNISLETLNTADTNVDPDLVTIPVIDLSADHGDVIAQIRDAGDRFGAFQAVGHGIAPELIADFEARINRIMTLPREQKVELASPSGHPYRGWRQWPDDFGRLELERYMIARFDDVDEARAAGVAEEHLSIYEHVNVWPADDPELRTVARRYRTELRALTERILGLFTHALGVPEERLKWDGPDATAITINNYPTWTWDDTEEDDDEVKLLLLEHADSNVVTLLMQQGQYEGLQTQHDDGTWHNVPVIPGAFVVLFGGSLARLVNDRWVTGRHRVIAGGTNIRRSTAVFYTPNLGAILAPIPELVGDEGTLHEPAPASAYSETFVEDYLRVFGRPDQREAWRTRTRFVAEVRENPVPVPL